MTSMDLESAVGDEVVSSRFHQGPRTRVAPRPDIRLQPPLLRQNIKTLPCKTGGVHIRGCQHVVGVRKNRTERSGVGNVPVNADGHAATVGAVARHAIQGALVCDTAKGFDPDAALSRKIITRFHSSNVVEPRHDRLLEGTLRVVGCLGCSAHEYR